MRRLAKTDRWLWIALLLTIAAVPVQLHETYHTIPSHWSDFLSQWMGCRALLHGTDPYSLAFTREIEMSFYGKIPSSPVSDPQAFVYPAHAVFVLYPFVVLPWKTARLVLTILLPPLVALSAWMWIRLCKVPRYHLLIVGLITLSWPAIWAYQQTQLTVVVVAALTGACFLLTKNYDIPAGILLAISTIKPNVVAVVIAWLLLQMIWQRRWRFLAAFAIPTAALLAVAQRLSPGWIPRWMVAATQYSDRPYKPPLLMLFLGHTVGFVAFAALGAWVVYRLWKTGVSAPGSPAFVYGIALTLAFTTCIIPTTPWMIYNQLALIPAALLVFTERERAPRASKISRWAIYELLAVVPLCALLALILGPRTALQFLPVLNVFIPPLLAIAIAAGSVSTAQLAPSLAPAPV